jgi:hypothetical protein
MRKLRTVAAATLLLVAGTAGSASAGALITSARIQDESVTGADVKNGSLTGTDVQDRSLTLDDFVDLPVGPKGETGPQGKPGRNGAPGVIQRSDFRIVQGDERRRWTVMCGAGEMSVGGGVSSERPETVFIEQSFPDGKNWTVQVHNIGTTPITVTGSAICLPT